MNKTTALWCFAALMGLLVSGSAAADDPLLDPWAEPAAKRPVSESDGDLGVIDPWQDTAPSPAAAPPASAPAVVQPFAAAVALNSHNLGLIVQPLTPALRRFFGVSQQAGVLVSQVNKNHAAAAAALRAGDVLVKVGSAAVTNADELRRALQPYKPGQQIPLVIVRAHRSVTLTLTVPTPDPEALALQRQQQLGELRSDMAQLKQQLRRLERRLDQLEAANGVGGPRLDSRQ